MDKKYGRTDILWAVFRKQPIQLAMIITKEEFEQLHMKVKGILRGRAEAFVMRFASCIGLEELTIPVSVLEEVRREFNSSLDVGDIIKRMNSLWQALNFRIYGDQNTHFASTAFTLKRSTTKYVYVSVDKAEMNGSQSGEPATEAMPELQPNPNPNSDDSDLSPEEWQQLWTMTRAWPSKKVKYVGILEPLFVSRPKPVSLSVLDELAKKIDDGIRFVWGSLINGLNTKLKEDGLKVGVRKMPNNRRASCKLGTSYSGHVTFYHLKPNPRKQNLSAKTRNDTISSNIP
jgi:hypothetical protein